MNSHQEARLSTSGTIREFFKNNIKIWGKNKLIAATIDKLDKNHDEIGETLLQQSIPITGYAKDKKKYRLLLNDTCAVLYAIFRANGAHTGSETIYDQFKKPKTALARVKDNEMYNLVLSAGEFATENRDELKDYGLTNQLFEKFNKEVAGYAEFLSKPGEAKAIRSAATKRLIQLFKELNLIYRRELDNLMAQFKFSQPDFYAQYKQVRRIYDNPTHKVSLFGKITNATTKKIIADATVTATPKDNSEQEKIIKLSTDKGNFRYKKLEPGLWIITFEKYGYQTISIELLIVKGKSYRRNIKMKENNIVSSI